MSNIGGDVGRGDHHREDEERRDPSSPGNRMAREKYPRQNDKYGLGRLEPKWPQPFLPLKRN